MAFTTGSRCIGRRCRRLPRRTSPKAQNLGTGRHPHVGLSAETGAWRSNSGARAWRRHDQEARPRERRPRPRPHPGGGTACPTAARQHGHGVSQVQGWGFGRGRDPRGRHLQECGPHVRWARRRGCQGGGTEGSESGSRSSCATSGQRPRRTGSRDLHSVHSGPTHHSGKGQAHASPCTKTDKVGFTGAAEYYSALKRDGSLDWTFRGVPTWSVTVGRSSVWTRAGLRGPVALS